MATWIRAVAVAVAMATVGGCGTVAANHEFNPAVDFDGYKTFSWISAHPLVNPSPAWSPLLEGRIQRTAKDLLTARGYRFVESAAEADFLVGFGLGATDKQRIDASPDNYRGAWHWPSPGEREVMVRQPTEGRLVVDIFDVRGHQPAWHGWATTGIPTGSGKDPQPDIRAALTAIFANFPPG